MSADATRERARDTAFDFLFWLEHRRKRKAPEPAQREAHRPLANNTQRVQEWLAANQPATVKDMVSALEIAESTVRNIMSHHRDWFEPVAKTKGRKLWRLAERR